jgi:telomerase protein component 1
MLSLLLVARDGLLETELLTLLGHKSEPLPQAKWAALYRGLHAYLRPTTESGEGTLGFFHSLFAKAAAKRYLVRDQETVCHKSLAGYFLSLADPTGDLTFQGTDSRAVSELAYHLTKARMWRELEAALTSLVFIERKCSQDQVYDLVEDLDLACSLADMPDSTRARLRDFHRYVAGNVHILTGLPRLVFQQAANQPDISVASSVAKARFDSGNEKRPWLRWANKPQKHDACLLTLAGYSEPVLAAAFSPDGTRMVTASRDRKLRIWDAKTGVEIAVMSGHTHWVVACHYSPDGSMIASASWDNTVKIWDAEVRERRCV